MSSDSLQYQLPAPSVLSIQSPGERRTPTSAPETWTARARCHSAGSLASGATTATTTRYVEGGGGAARSKRYKLDRPERHSKHAGTRLPPRGEASRKTGRRIPAAGKAVRGQMFRETTSTKPARPASPRPMNGRRLPGDGGRCGSRTRRFDCGRDVPPRL